MLSHEKLQYIIYCDAINQTILRYSDGLGFYSTSFFFSIFHFRDYFPGVIDPEH